MLASIGSIRACSKTSTTRQASMCSKNSRTRSKSTPWSSFGKIVNGDYTDSDVTARAAKEAPFCANCASVLQIDVSDTPRKGTMLVVLGDNVGVVNDGQCHATDIGLGSTRGI